MSVFPLQQRKQQMTFTGGMQIWHMIVAHQTNRNPFDSTRCGHRLQVFPTARNHSKTAPILLLAENLQAVQPLQFRQGGFDLAEGLLRNLQNMNTSLRNRI